MSRKTNWAIAAATIAITLAAPARADMIVTFDASGTFADGSTLGGSIAIDTTTGIVAAVDLTVTGPTDYIFPALLEAYRAGSNYEVVAKNPSTSDVLGLDLFSATTLVDYAGGAIASGQVEPFAGPTLSLQSGSLTAEVATAVPEPSSLALCRIAALAGAGYAWRRRKRARPM